MTASDLAPAAASAWVLDFDGVVVDGLDECLLTAWLVHHRLPAEAFDEVTLAAIPPAFRARFAELRNFVRHDGHFLVAFATDATPADAVEFEALWAGFPEEDRAAFRAAFVALRTEVRARRADVWLRLHTVFPELLPHLAEGRVHAIVSGKDAPSIAAILAAVGIDFPPDRIFGRVGDKRPVLDDLARAARDEGRALVFCDDNVDNVVDAIAAGVPTLWATWGFSTAAQRARAAAAGLRGVTALELSALMRAA